MNSKNIPADIKSKSLKEARDEIDVILVKLESNNLDLDSVEKEYKRLMSLNKHVENIAAEAMQRAENFLTPVIIIIFVSAI